MSGGYPCTLIQSCFNADLLLLLIPRRALPASASSRFHSTKVYSCFPDLAGYLCSWQRNYAGGSAAVIWIEAVDSEKSRLFINSQPAASNTKAYKEVSRQAHCYILGLLEPGMDSLAP